MDDEIETSLCLADGHPPARNLHVAHNSALQGLPWSKSASVYMVGTCRGYMAVVAFVRLVMN